MTDDTVRIELRRRSGPSMWTIIDRADWALVGQYTWYAKRGGRTWYAGTTYRQNGRVCGLAMHRLIFGPTDGDVDHQDGDGLNNRRSNLRPATRLENMRNRRKQLMRNGKPCSSQFKGVMRRGARWMAYIRVDGEREYLGTYATEDAAARAYDRRAREAFGEFAAPNFPDGEAAA